MPTRITAQALSQYRRLAGQPHAEFARLAELVGSSGRAPAWVPRPDGGRWHRAVGDLLLVFARDPGGDRVLVAVVEIGSARAEVRKGRRAASEARRKRVRARRRALKRGL